jgi:hypothetical protein
MNYDTSAFVVVATVVRINMTLQENLLAHILPLDLHGNPIRTENHSLTVETPQRFAESRTPTANREWSRVIRLSLLDGLRPVIYVNGNVKSI